MTDALFFVAGGVFGAAAVAVGVICAMVDVRMVHGDDGKPARRM